MTYLDVWRSGTSLMYSCKAAFWIQEASPRLSDVEHSVILRSVFAIGSALAYLLFLRECGTPPHVQVRHTMWLSFTRPSPALVLQATNAGARRPGYEANTKLVAMLRATVELYTFFNSGVSSEGTSIASLDNIMCNGVFPSTSCVLTSAPYPTSRSTILL